MPTEFENFKSAFLSSCRAAGLNDAEIEQSVDALLGRCKQAFSLNSIPGYSIAETFGKSVANEAPNLGVGMYFGIPTIAGAAAGAGLAKLRDLGDEDPAEVRTRERIDAYRNLARQMAIRDRLRLLNRPQRAHSPLVR